MTSEDSIEDGRIGDTEPQPFPESVESGIDHAKAREGVRLLLQAVGEDPDSDELVDTWQRRVPEAFETLTEGKRTAEKPTMRTFETNNDSLVIKTDIPVYSLCEHHLLPYHGTIHVAYRPNGEAAGLSKLTRYVRWQSRRLTMQEQLTDDIAEGLAEELNADAVLVELSATHMCEAMRGIETASKTTSWAAVGNPTDAELDRFRQAIRRASTNSR